DEIIERHLGEVLDEIGTEGLELGGRTREVVCMGRLRRRGRDREQSEAQYHAQHAANLPPPYWIFATSESVAPLLSTQLTLTSSPFGPPLKLNLGSGSLDPAGPHNGVKTVFPPCSNCTTSM